MSTSSPERQRLDKWLWHARMTRTRSLAAKLVAAGHVRVNGLRVKHPARSVRVGDVLTVALAHTTRVLEIAALGQRRGASSSALTLYRDDVHRSEENSPGVDRT